MSTRKHILITALLYGPGGIETHLLNLSRVLVAHGAEVTILSRFASPSAPLVQFGREIPIRLITTPFAEDLRWFRFSTAWALATWPLLLRLRRFDVLYTTELSRFTSFVASYVKPGGQVLWGIAGAPLGHIPETYANALSLFTGALAETEMQAEAACRALKHKLPVGAIPLLGHILNPPIRRRKPVKELRVAFLGRYHRLKGVYRLLDLWPELDIQPARLDFYGHGDEQKGLENEICRRGLSQQVHINGGWSRPEELSAILAGTDLVVLPSEMEGLPVVLLEAMAHGVPFVASDVGAIRTLAQDNPDVEVVALDNAILKSATQRMACDLRAGRIQGERLQQYHRAHYSYEVLSESWVNALLHPERFWNQST